MTAHHLAQVNIAKARYDVADPRMAGFMDNLDPINELGDRSAGFVWRYQTEEGDATATRVFDDPEILLNLTVWESVDALREYVFRTDHVEFLRRRREWFIDSGYPTTTLWWIPVGELPTPIDARRRVEMLQSEGPTIDAFTFASVFPSPGDLDNG